VLKTEGDERLNQPRIKAEVMINKSFELKSKGKNRNYAVSITIDRYTSLK